MSDRRRIDSRTARAKLPAAHDPVWHKAGHALHLGYRKSDKGASWIARGYDGARYHKKTIGRPDDVIEADGDKVLTFTQAVAAAFAWWENRGTVVELVAAPAGPLTVDMTADDYMRHYEARGGKDLGSVKSRVQLHVRPAFGTLEVAKLTKAEIERWLFAIAAEPRRYRQGKLTSKVATLDSSDPEALRRRQSAANRTLTVLKAILNRAFENDDRVPSDKAWRTVKPFEAVDASRERALSEKEAAALIGACSGSFRDLVQVALLTGCRYGELAALPCGDIELAQATLFVARSKSGHPRHVALTPSAVDLFRRLIGGRKGKEPVFIRKNGEPWRRCDQVRPMRAACVAAGIEPPVGFHILRHTHASELVMRGLSLQVVAKQIGHRSTVMTEKHYAHLQPSFVASEVRRVLPNFGAD